MNKQISERVKQYYQDKDKRVIADLKKEIEILQKKCLEYESKLSHIRGYIASLYVEAGVIADDR